MGDHQPRHLRRPEHLATPPKSHRRAVVGGAALIVLGAALVARSWWPASIGAPAGGHVDAGDTQEISVCIQSSISERAGHTLVLGLSGVTDADDPLIARFAAAHVGGVMLRDDNIVDEDQARELIDGLRAKLGHHVLVALDDEGGRVSALGALGESIPSARRLGTRGPEAAREAGVELGELAASIGVDWILAPVADLDDGPADGLIGDRSFSSDPQTAADAAVAFMEGVQSAGVKVTAKHFPGGGANGDPHTGEAHSDRTLEALREDDLEVFDQLISSGADAVMVGHTEYPEIWRPDRPASLEPDAYRLLRSTGFDGVAITDALGMGAVHARWGFDVAPAMAIGAGADAVLVAQGEQVETLHDGLVRAVEDGSLDEDRLDEAVGRVLRLQGQDPTGIVCATPRA